VVRKMREPNVRRPVRPRFCRFIERRSRAVRGGEVQ
jgi:hypothetical protein